MFLADKEYQGTYRNPLLFNVKSLGWLWAQDSLILPTLSKRNDF